MATREVQITVNGALRRCRVSDRLLLADLLRDELGLTGTKVGCGHGVCGSCTVHVDGRAVRSCLLFAAQAEGSEIRTVEGLAADGALHPLQDAFHDHHALQCGFCTPGFLMALLPHVEAGEVLDEAQARALADANLCRCTGYQGIVEAIVEASAKSAETTP